MNLHNIQLFQQEDTSDTGMKLSKIRPLRNGEQDGLRVVFALGDFVEVLDKPVPYQKRLHNHEVMSLEEVKGKLGEIRSLGVHE